MLSWQTNGSEPTKFSSNTFLAFTTLVIYLFIQVFLRKIVDDLLSSVQVKQLFAMKITKKRGNMVLCSKGIPIPNYGHPLLPFYTVKWYDDPGSISDDCLYYA